MLKPGLGQLLLLDNLVQAGNVGFMLDGDRASTIDALLVKHMARGACTTLHKPVR